MAVDFIPTMGDYKTLQPFRYWCQKVLPLVYDDSLSYYELLCKVVDYLNKTMEDVETLHGDVENLLEAYTLLQGYVNDYFDNLDVQEEIDNKLDSMVDDGTFDTLLAPYMAHYQDELNLMKNRITVLETNYDAGGTTADAELADIRVGYNGITYPTAGDSVRGQVKSVAEELDDINERTRMTNLFTKYGVTSGIVVGEDGTTHADARFITSGYMPIDDALRYVTQKDNYTAGFTVVLCCYNSSNTLLKYSIFDQYEAIKEYVPEPNGAYVRMSVATGTYESGFEFRAKDSTFDTYDSDIAWCETNITEIQTASDMLDLAKYYGWTDNAVLNNTGGTTYDNRFKTTDFIPVEAESYVTEKLNFTAAFTLYRATYDSSKNLIQYVSYTHSTAQRDYLTPYGVAYIKFSVSNAVQPDFRFRLKYNAFETIEFDKQLNQEARNYTSDIAKTTEGVSSYGVFFGELQSNGDFGAYPDRYCTDYIPVEYGKKYVFEVIGTAQYSPKVGKYDANKDFISLWQTNFNAPLQYFTPDANTHFIRFSFSTAVYNRDIKFRLAENRFDEIDKYMHLDNGAYSYTGSKVDLSIPNGYFVTKMFDGISAPSGTTAQGFAVYNDKLFQLMADDVCVVYDLAKNGEYVTQFSLTSGHGNSAVFSKEFYSASDEFPLLYISDIDGNVYVNRISNYTATLIRTLYFGTATFGNTPQLALGDSNYCYVVGNLTGTDVFRSGKFTVCDLSNLTANGDGTYTPQVVDTFTLAIPGDYPVLQGIKYLNSKLYLASGGGSTSVLSEINVVDLTSKTIVTTIDEFPTTMSVNELEDIDFIKNPFSAKYDIIAHVRTIGYYRVIF